MNDNEKIYHNRLLQLTLIEGYIGETGSCVNRVVSVGITVSPANWHLAALFQ